MIGGWVAESRWRNREGCFGSRTDGELPYRALMADWRIDSAWGAVLG